MLLVVELVVELVLVIQVMLVVLAGDGCNVLLNAARLIEQFNRVGVRILVVESAVSGQLERFNTGPLPQCITSLPPNSSSVLKDAAINQSHSSMMFLMTIHRAPKRHKPTLERPMAKDSLIVTPCTQPTNSISYHPQIYSNYLRTMLLNYKNVSFARVMSQEHLNSMVHSLISSEKQQPVIVIKIFNEPMELTNMELAHIHWEGIADWKMPNLAHWVRKRKNSVCRLKQAHIGGHPSFEIISSYHSFDLNGAMITSQMISDLVNRRLMEANLRWPRL